MKLSESQLRKIIKQEIKGLLNEVAPVADVPQVQAAVEASSDEAKIAKKLGFSVSDYVNVSRENDNTIVVTSKNKNSNTVVRISSNERNNEIIQKLKSVDEDLKTKIEEIERKGNVKIALVIVAVFAIVGITFQQTLGSAGPTDPRYKR